MSPLRIALAQINVTVGDISANELLIIKTIERARALEVDLIVFPELVLSGYPPEDLLLNASFLDACETSLGRIAAATANATTASPDAKGIIALVGSPLRAANKLYNAAAVLHDGGRLGDIRKIELPNYGVFDELRYFTPGAKPGFIALGDSLISVSICEDVWIAGNRVERAGRSKKPGLAINISASPFHVGKFNERHAVLSRFAAAVGCPLAYTNLVGGQDELVFDGGSLVLDPDGMVKVTAKRFAEDLLVVDLDLPAASDATGSDQAHLEQARSSEEDVIILRLPRHSATRRPAIPCRAEADGGRVVRDRVVRERVTRDRVTEIRHALVLGTADYVRKNGFQHVVIGLSGGIDSALVAALAVEALSASAVTGVTMPSRHSSAATLADAHMLARNLGIECLEIPIDEFYATYLDRLASPLGYDRGTLPGIEAENLQARIRGNIVMTLSNRFGWLVLTTGNKSELAMGYCTLYGDMAGGFAVLKDVFKTTVYELAEQVNAEAGRELIPRSTITRAPTAELRPDQKDEDSLPPYRVLDPVLAAYVEEDRGANEIAAATGANEELVQSIIRKVDFNEYKRRQGPPGVKITPRAFGKDRRRPITNRWR